MFAAERPVRANEGHAHRMDWRSAEFAILVGLVALAALALVVGVAAWRRRRAFMEVERVLTALGRGERIRQIRQRFGGWTGRLVRLVNRLAPELESRQG